MERVLLTLFFITFTLSIVSSLKCFDCNSIVSYGNCDGNRQEITCDASQGQDRCIKIDVSYTLHSKDHENFKRGCVKSKECSPKINQMCKAAAYGTSKECNVNCCSTDLCNAGSNVMVSVILLVACVFGILALF